MACAAPARLSCVEECLQTGGGGGNPYVHMAPGYLKSFGLGLILYLAAGPIILSCCWCESLQRNNNVLTTQNTCRCRIRWDHSLIIGLPSA